MTFKYHLFWYIRWSSTSDTACDVKVEGSTVHGFQMLLELTPTYFELVCERKQKLLDFAESDQRFSTRTESDTKRSAQIRNAVDHLIFRRVAEKWSKCLSLRAVFYLARMNGLGVFQCINFKLSFFFTSRDSFVCCFHTHFEELTETQSELSNLISKMRRFWRDISKTGIWIKEIGTVFRNKATRGCSCGYNIFCGVTKEPFPGQEKVSSSFSTYNGHNKKHLLVLNVPYEWVGFEKRFLILIFDGLLEDARRNSSNLCDTVQDFGTGASYTVAVYMSLEAFLVCFHLSRFSLRSSSLQRWMEKNTTLLVSELL